MDWDNTSSAGGVFAPFFAGKEVTCLLNVINSMLYVSFFKSATNLER